MTHISTHRIHVWYIYLHLVDLYTICRYIYHTWILWAPVKPIYFLPFTKGFISFTPQKKTVGFFLLPTLGPPAPFKVTIVKASNETCIFDSYTPKV